MMEQTSIQKEVGSFLPCGWDVEPDAAPKRMVLDVGCGNNKIPDAIGMDCVALPGVDVIHDLSSFPYPFNADSIDAFHINHVLEHLSDVIGTMEELWRIAKPGATVHIRVPHFTGVLAWRDPTHRRSFTSESFRYFGDNSYSYYTHARFQVVSVRLRYVAHQESCRGFSRWLARAVQSMLDNHLAFCERYLAYLLGGIDEIRVTLKAIKPLTGSGMGASVPGSVNREEQRPCRS
ncbi:MAG TPA: methyltransferase domain-containing protein [Terriglobales bacterium]|jgi:SAM-dependent methyltransferase|nr:methyltransferase domain-containing protein [Terriglobales bacterium]